MFYFALKIEKDNQIAFAGCWVVDQSMEAAKKKCVELIRSQDWVVLEHLEAYPITRDFYSENSERLQYYEQALIDGEVLVIYTADQ